MILAQKLSVSAQMSEGAPGSRAGMIDLKPGVLFPLTVLPIQRKKGLLEDREIDRSKSL